MTTERLLALLQLADGLFPAGGFAHSFGLETYVHEGLAGDAGALAALVAAHLEGAAGPADAVAARAAAAGALGPCLDADLRLDAMKWVPELRAASVQMGRQTARMAAAVAGDPLVAALDHAIAEGVTPGHHAVAFGAALGRQGVEPEPAAAAYLHATVALLVNAALRLLPLGQLAGQRVLAGARPAMARLAAVAAAATVDEMWSFTPALELAGLRHARLDRRMFRS
jgi:urease accessory protein